MASPVDVHDHLPIARTAQIRRCGNDSRRRIRKVRGRRNGPARCPGTLSLLRPGAWTMSGRTVRSPSGAPASPTTPCRDRSGQLSRPIIMHDAASDRESPPVADTDLRDHYGSDRHRGGSRRILDRRRSPAPSTLSGCRFTCSPGPSPPSRTSPPGSVIQYQNRCRRQIAGGAKRRDGRASEGIHFRS
jgi:hypothetical protein